MQDAQGLSIRSAEPVGVWRAYQTPEDLLACVSETSPRQRDSRCRDRIVLSAAMIVRNEEKNLRPCLDSLLDVVDEVVVVDTGSTDNTKAIATQFGARVFRFPWTDDFSAPRNAALDQVRGDWILSVDADETLQPFPRAALVEQLSDSTTGGCYVLVRRRQRLTPNWQMKLFRNHPGLRHHGVIHEGITPGQVRSVTGLRLGMVPMLFEHSGYDRDLHRKHLRNLPLLLRELESYPESPEQSHIWGHLADVNEALGELQLATAASERAVKLLRKKGALHPADCAAYLRLLTWHVARRERLDGLLDEASQLFPDNLQLLWIRGRWLMDQERHREAVPCFEKLVSRGGASGFDCWVGYDRRLFDVLSYRSLATCHFRMGSAAKARRYSAMAGQCRNRRRT